MPFVRSPKNAARRMRPDEFDRWLKVFFRGFDFAQQKEAKNLLKHPDRVLRETFRAAMAICGCESDLHFSVSAALRRKVYTPSCSLP